MFALRVEASPHVRRGQSGPVEQWSETNLSSRPTQLNKPAAQIQAEVSVWVLFSVSFNRSWKDSRKQKFSGLPAQNSTG